MGDSGSPLPKPARPARRWRFGLKRRAGASTPDAPSGHAVIRAIAYGPDGIESKDLGSAEEVAGWRGKSAVTWIDIDSNGDTAAVQRIGEVFGMHPLVIEDVLSREQRSKVEPYDEHHLIVVRMFERGEGPDADLSTEQMSVVVGRDWVVSFQERVGDCLDPVRERLRTGRGRIRKAGADFLAYAILDAVVDHYFPLLESYGERLDELEEEVLERPSSSTPARIHGTKRELLVLRRSLWPLREAIRALSREESQLVAPETRIWLRDCHDHVVQLLDIVETFRDTTSGLTDLYVSAASHRLNEVMKVLTVIATIFIPLTFLAGIWGMNFDPDTSPWNMPELRWAFGYPTALGLMTLTALALVVYFYRKGWLGASRRIR